MRLLTRVYGVEGVGLPLYYCSRNMFEEQLTNSKKIFYKQHSTPVHVCVPQIFFLLLR